MDHLRQVFLSSRDALGVSLRGKHVMVNPAYLALFGYERDEELLGTSILALIAPSARDEVAELIRLRADGKSAPETYESRGLRRDGSEFDLQVHVSNYGEGESMHSLVTLRDVTERNRAHELAASEEKFRLLTEQALVGVAIQQDDRLVFVNKVLCDMLEVAREELVGVPAEDLERFVDADHMEMVRSQMRKGPDVPLSEIQYSFRARTKSGRTKWMELHGKPITWQGRPAQLISTLDIDALHAAETLSLIHI